MNNNFTNYNFQQLKNATPNKCQSQNISILNDMSVNVEAKIGGTTMQMKEVLDLTPGSLIPLKKDSQDMNVDILVQGKKIGRGSIVVDSDNVYIQVTELNNKKH